MLKGLIAVGLVVSALALEALGAPQDEAAIRGNVAAFEAAVNKRDVAGVVATYTLDGDFVFFDGPRVVGREAIRKWTTDDLATMPSTKRITLTVTGIRFLADDIAIAETTARFNEGEARENRGTSVFVRQNGRWLVAALRVYPAQRP